MYVIVWILSTTKAYHETSVFETALGSLAYRRLLALIRLGAQLKSLVVSGLGG